MPIDPIPPIPEQIIEAVNKGKFVVFIGAGVSRLVGCEGWVTLANNLVETCYEQKIIKYKEKEILISETDHRKTITICFSLLKEAGLEDVFYSQLEKSLKSEEKVTKPNIYDDIYQLRGICITTNADVHYHRFYDPKNIKYLEEDFTEKNIATTNLLCIHGTIIHRDSLIFTLESYFKRYKINEFVTFLKTIFNGEYTVLFLGYGLAEFELIEYLYSDIVDDKKDLKHFMLMPFYVGEDNLVKYQQNYYGKMGVSVLAYSKDDRGYEQLNEIMKSWQREINLRSNYQYKTKEEIDSVIDSYGK